MFTAAASRFENHALCDFDQVGTRAELAARGIDADQIGRQVAARRWQVFGSAVVLHNGELTVAQHRRVMVIKCGPRAALTSFSSAHEWGLRGWDRDEVHVLAPAGTRRPQHPGLVLHRAHPWRPAQIAHGRRLHLLAPSLVVAAASFASARPACGILAAGVQQRLTCAAHLRDALEVATRTRHRAVLLRAVDDIEQGAQALSEIDFVALCRRHRLPEPTRHAVRVERGRRRYLDVEWRLPDGRVVAAEIDGALHLVPQRWYDDQLRQNEIVLGGTVVLRFPSVVVRAEEALVVDQLRRLLGRR